MKHITPEDLGIELEEPLTSGVFKWLVASFLMGKRIRSSVAVSAYRGLVAQHVLDSPFALARASHHGLVRFLGRAGYARYDESTARRLQAMGVRLDSELEGQLPNLTEGQGDFERWLLTFEGGGPKTLEIFMRPLRAQKVGQLEKFHREA